LVVVVELSDTLASDNQDRGAFEAAGAKIGHGLVALRSGQVSVGARGSFVQPAVARQAP
jgi:hypothetical protein